MQFCSLLKPPDSMDYTQEVKKCLHNVVLLSINFFNLYKLQILILNI